MKKDAAPEKRWHFPSTDGGDTDGLNDPLQEYFEGDHERYIARESIQNSIDARLSNRKPVRVHFERLELDTNKLPDKDRLMKVFLKAKEFSEGQEGGSEFFKKALRQLKSEKIPVLKISDFNTVGLSGSDDDPDGGWYRLVRSVGSSSLTGVGGGSFGIGKGAAFAASALHTVFYSTVNNKKESVFQGKCRISSFQDKEGDIRRGVGQFGLRLDRGVASIRAKEDIPTEFQRSKQGTDVYIIGYDAPASRWEKALIASVLKNFWASIHFGDLVVSFKDKRSEFEINSKDLLNYLERFSDEGHGALPYYRAVTDPDLPAKKKLNHLGNVQLFIKKGDGYPRRVQMMRLSRMLVYEQQYRVLPEAYAGVFICEDKGGNKLLRDLEPPAHDAWDQDRDAEKGQKIMIELHNWIRSVMRQLADKSGSEPEEIPDLNKYLPEIEEDAESRPQDEGTPEQQPEQQESADELGSEQEEQEIGAQMPTRQAVSVVKAARGKDASRQGEKNRRNKTHDDGTSDEKGKYPRIDTSDLGFRSFAVAGKDKPEYRLILKSPADQTGALRVLAVGDDAAYPVDVASAKDANTGEEYTADGAMITGLQLKAGKAVHLSVQLASKNRYNLWYESYGR